MRKHAPADMELCVIFSVPMDDAKRQLCQPFSKGIQRFADHAGASVQCPFDHEKTAGIRLLADNISVSTFQINTRAGGRAKETGEHYLVTLDNIESRHSRRTLGSDGIHGQ